MEIEGDGAGKGETARTGRRRRGICRRSSNVRRRLLLLVKRAPLATFRAARRWRARAAVESRALGTIKLGLVETRALDRAALRVLHCGLKDGQQFRKHREGLLLISRRR